MTPLRSRSAAFLSTMLTLLAVGLPAALEAQPGRISITVTDPGGAPLADVKVSVTTPERGDVKVETVTNKKGKAMIMVPNVALRYDLVLARDGYGTVTTDVKPQLGETAFREYQLAPNDQVATSGETTGAEERVFTPAELAFNDGVTALAKDDVDTALAKFLEARDKDPGLTAVYSALAAIYLEKKQPQEALAAAQRHLEAEPGSPRGLRLVYDAQKQLGNNAEAEKALRELQSKKGDEVAILLFNEGAEAVKVGDLDNAERRFVEALAAKPDLHQATDALMIVYARKSDWANAAAQAEKALANDPASKRALRVRYEAYSGLGDAEKAKQALAALAEADPTALIGSFLDAGVAKFNANDTQGAIADFTRVIEIDPNHATAHYHLGICYASASQPAQAKTHLERFLELAPNDANAATAREMLKYTK